MGRLGLPGISLWPSAVGRTVAVPIERAVFGEIYPGDASIARCPGTTTLAYRWIRKGKIQVDRPCHPHGKQQSPWNRYVENATSL